MFSLIVKPNERGASFILEDTNAPEAPGDSFGQVGARCLAAARRLIATVSRLRLISDLNERGASFILEDTNAPEAPGDSFGQVGARCLAAARRLIATVSRLRLI